MINFKVKIKLDLHTCNYAVWVSVNFNPTEFVLANNKILKLDMQFKS